MCSLEKNAASDAEFRAPGWEIPRGSFAPNRPCSCTIGNESGGTVVAQSPGMHTPTAAITTSLMMVRAEYREMPGLHLTKPQIKRLCGLDEPVCEALLDILISSNFLKRTLHDAYVRADGGA